MDAFSLLAKLSLDSSEYDSGLERAGAALGKVGGALKTGFATIAKVGTVAMGAATAGVIGLTKASVESYADFEQLVGGVETLFGSSYKSVEEYAQGVGVSMEFAAQTFDDYQKRQQTVLNNANNAYKTAGLSANEYMETVTSFAAALNSSLGDHAWQSANYADTAISDMADNANKMGTSMEAIQNAYMGFSKQNFTMLDNLKLGYGGTKTEMERLMRDAEELEGLEIGSLDTNNFADVVDAIHIIQENLGIYGTTAKEAEKTISGSLAMTKSAWQNLITGLTNPDADLGVLINNMVDSATIAMDNLMPAIEQALGGIGKFVENIAPIIADKIPSLVETLLPPLINAASTLLQGVVSALPSFEWIIFDMLREVDAGLEQLVVSIQNFDWAGAAASIMEYISSMFVPGDSVLESIAINAITLIKALAQGITETIPVLLPAAMDLIAQFAEFLAEQAPSLIDTAIDLVLSLVDGITNPTSLSNMLIAAVDLIMSLADGLIQNIPKITAAIPKIIDNLVQTFSILAPKLLVAALQLIIQLELGLIQNIPTLLAAIPEIIGAIVTGIIQMGGELIKAGAELIEDVEQGFKSLDPLEWGKDLVNKFVQGIKNSIGKVKDAVGSVAETVKSYLHFSEPDKGALANFHTYAPDMMKLFAQGIVDNAGIVEDAMNKSFALPDMTANTSAVNGGSVVINVYGAEGQSERKLAEEISNILTHNYNMEKAVWGTT